MTECQLRRGAIVSETIPYGVSIHDGVIVVGSTFRLHGEEALHHTAANILGDRPSYSEGVSYGQMLSQQIRANVPGFSQVRVEAYDCAVKMSSMFDIQAASKLVEEVFLATLRSTTPWMVRQDGSCRFEVHFGERLILPHGDDCKTFKHLLDNNKITPLGLKINERYGSLTGAQRLNPSVKPTVFVFETEDTTTEADRKAIMELITDCIGVNSLTLTRQAFPR